MKMEYRSLKVTAFAVAALLISTLASAADETEAAGVVVMAVGEVTVTGGAGGERPLKRRSPIFTGETITTGKQSRAQLRFGDGSLVSLQEGSQFHIEGFSYQQQQKADNAAFKLLKGGMRTISGAVGKVNRDEYKVETPVATIGIRGTDYELVVISPEANGAPSAGDGYRLYGYINDGRISVSNGAGQQNFSDNEFFTVPGADMPPQALLNPPGVMFEGYVPPSTESDEAANDVAPLDPSLLAILTSTENSDLLNSTTNPLITPYATVAQLTGWMSYTIPTDGAFVTDQNGIATSLVDGLIYVDFDNQWINDVWLNIYFANDLRSISLSSQPAGSISSVIGEGQAITMIGSCSGGPCGDLTSLPLTGTFNMQFIGANAESIAATFNAQDVASTQVINGSAIFNQDPSAGW